MLDKSGEKVVGLVEFMLLEWLRLPHGSSGTRNCYVI